MTFAEASPAWDGERDYERFKQAVPESRRAVWAVSEHLQGKGHAVLVVPFALCPSFEERNSGYGDNFDLAVLLNVEVKHHDFDFTCAADYPYANIIVDRANKVDRLGDRIAQYWQTNRLLSHALVIHRSTRSLWFKQRITDSKKGFGYEAYMLPKKHAVFAVLTQRLSADGQ